MKNEVSAISCLVVRSEMEEYGLVEKSSCVGHDGRSNERRLRVETMTEADEQNNSSTMHRKDKRKLRESANQNRRH